MRVRNVLFLLSVPYNSTSTSTFVRTTKGYKVTGPEGFVAVDQVGKAVKLVDRLEFAHQNFSAAKNWTK